MRYSAMGKLSRGAHVCAAIVGLCVAQPEGALAACSWSTILPGTTADATQVMNNFDCLAPTSVPSFMGRVSIAPNISFQPSSIAIQRGAMGALASDQAGWTYQHNGGLSGLNEAIVFDTGTGGNDYRLRTGGNDRLVINGTSGMVGIGTIAPVAGLDVEASNSYTSGKFGPNKPLYLMYDWPQVGFNLYFTSSGYFYGKGSSSSYGGAIGVAPTTGVMYFWNTSTPGSAGAAATVSARMALSQAGNLGIGTVTPGQRLDVAGTIRQSSCTTAGTLSTNASGDIICTSDARLKNIRGTYTEGLAALSKVIPQRFIFKPSKSNPRETFIHAGFIAQNVKAAIPEAVAQQRNGFYSLDTTAILATSVNAIKELQADNRDLRRKLHQLEALNEERLLTIQSKLENISQEMTGKGARKRTVSILMDR